MMQSNQALFLQAPLQAFYSKPFYREVARQWRGSAYLYLLLILIVSWLPPLVKFQLGMNRFLAGRSERLLDQVPLILLSNGFVSADISQPFSLRDPESGEVYLIIDTTGQIQSLDGVDAWALLTRSKIFLRSGERETRVYDLSNVQNLRIDRERVASWLRLFTRWAVPSICFVMVVLVFAGRLVLGLVLALLGLFIQRFVGSRLSFATILPLAVVAQTPSILIATVLDLLSVESAVATVTMFLITIGFLVFAIAANADEDGFKANPAGG